MLITNEKLEISIGEVGISSNRGVHIRGCATSKDVRENMNIGFEVETPSTGRLIETHFELSKEYVTVSISEDLVKKLYHELSGL